MTECGKNPKLYNVKVNKNYIVYLIIGIVVVVLIVIFIFWFRKKKNNLK